MTSNLSPIWQQRWQALAATMHNTNIQAESETLDSLLKCLSAFGKSQFEFFYNGFKNDRLLPSMYYPAEHVLSATLAQVSYDLSAIRQAADQRRTPQLKTVLDKADQLAQGALNLAVDKQLIPPSAVVTYFNKSPNIRVIPYAPVALVGIPYTAVTTSRDLLAVPHEIGHYVYHHAVGLAAKLHTQIPLDPPWFNRWIEEMFADIYGCLVAGPVIGADFQDLLLDNPTEHFVEDDGEHPVDAIRPYLYSHILEQLGFNNAASALTARWQRYEKLRNYPESFVPFDSDYEVDLRIGRDMLETVSGQILDYLTAQYSITPTSYWSQDMADDETDVETMYTAFENWANGDVNVHANILKVNNREAGVDTGTPPIQNKRRLGSTNTWRDDLKAIDQTLPWPAWELIFTSGFWPIKGPEGNGDTGL